MLINNHKLHLETYGPPSGPPVILLHHGLGSSASWKRQIPALVNAGMTVIAYDRWGYGKSAARSSLAVPHFEPDLADLETIMRRLKLDRVALVGHSDGGTIALSFAARHPEKVSCVVCIAAHIYVEAKMKPGIESVRAAFENDKRIRSGLLRRHGEKFAQVFENWYSAWVKEEHLSWDMRPTLEQIQCPVLVVQGAEDEHATPQHAADIAAAIPQAELWLVPGARHMLPQEHAKAFNARLLSFLADTPRQGSRRSSTVAKEK